MTAKQQLIEDMDNLRHMLGVCSTKPRKQWCWRNYYNANDGDESMARLVASGLAEQYRPNYFRATEAGCQAIGLSAKEIHKALHGD